MNTFFKSCKIDSFQILVTFLVNEDKSQFDIDNTKRLEQIVDLTAYLH